MLFKNITFYMLHDKINKLAVLKKTCQLQC